MIQKRQGQEPKVPESQNAIVFEPPVAPSCGLQMPLRHQALLPTEQKFKQAKERMQHWWQAAWLDDEQPNIQTANSKRFFAEANIALPGLSSDNSSIDDLFEALVMQRGRLKEMQQLREW